MEKVTNVAMVVLNSKESYSLLSGGKIGHKSQVDWCITSFTFLKKLEVSQFLNVIN